jgi:putative spermidine/putrescine transport system ATP-binding protein
MNETFRQATNSKLSSNRDDEFLRFANVSKTFDGRTQVVKDLNFTIRREEFLTLLGPSGSGKTTTLLMVAGFETPTFGDILLEGNSLKNIPPYNREIGMVFQNYALFPHMTVEENLAFPLKARRLASADVSERVHEALAMVQLETFGRRRPNQLSGGQQQRVALARALIYRPKVVLMDEPLGALDKQLREQMQQEIRRIHASVGITIVYVTHDQGEALALSNRIAVFKEGSIQQIGRPAELYESPQNAFVAQFIGESNRLTGTVVSDNGLICRVAIDGGDETDAIAVNCGPSGSRTTLSLRPENVQIDPAAQACEFRFQATVREIVYLGDHLRVLVDVCGCKDFIIKVPRAHEASRIRIGQVLGIGWDKKDCRALDLQQGSTTHRK